MLRDVGRVPYRLFGRLPSSAKQLANHVVASHFLVGMIAVVLNERDELLVLEHTYRPGFSNGLPSGWLKRGEALTEAMAREIAEETSFRVEFRRVLWAETRQKPLRLDVWLQYELAGGEFRPSREVSGAVWATPDTLPPMLESQRRFVVENWDRLADRGG